MNGRDSLNLTVVLSLDYLELARSHIQYLLELFLINMCWLLLWVSLLFVVGFGLKLGHPIMALCFWIISVIYMNFFNNGGIMETMVGFRGGGDKIWLKWWEKISSNSCKIHQHNCHRRKGQRTLLRMLFLIWVLGWTIISLWIFLLITFQATENRKETLASMCDERARMLQDQFIVNMNHIQAMSILISTFHHARSPSAIDQVIRSQFTGNELTGLIEHRLG